MALEFRILPGSPLPIYRQLMDQLRMAIAKGNLAPGDQLPSVRALAEQLLVNPNTVARAYAALTDQRLLETVQGKGVFVSATAPKQPYTKAESLRRLDPSIESFVHESLALGLSPEQM